MSSSAIRAEGVSKQYSIGALGARRPSATLYDAMSAWLGKPLQRLRQLGGRIEEDDRFWALSDVDFEIREGDAVGIIGRNGAGKSTLLKILSRITPPTMGRITMRGRLASLLEVGTGFHPELSGRENIYLNGAIMGMQRREVNRKFDEIVSFAGVEAFVDTPVKRYSSGMYVRLAFAVAAHLEADILVVDEVLAVGDAAFQRKSLNKMDDVAKGGRTILFVSHNLAAIRNLCTRSLLLEQGRLVFDGTASEGISQYERSFANAGSTLMASQFRGPLAETLELKSIVYRQAGAVVEIIDPLTEFEIELRGTARKSLSSVDLKLAFFRDGVFLASCHDTDHDSPIQEGEFTSRFTFPPSVFRPGRYFVGIGVNAGVGVSLWGMDVAVLDVSESQGGMRGERGEGIIAIPHRGERIQ